MSDAHFRTGTVIGSHYEIIRPLGSGSMGMVYLCRHLGLDDVFLALKVLSLSNTRKSSTPENEYIARFRNELTATYRVNSPFVVRTYEYVEEPNCVAYTMEYVSGGDLQRLIHAVSVIPIPNVVKLLVQACEGVQAIHEAGIIHRDLKPGNILLTERGDVKITDFGIARLPGLPRLTATGNVLGTFEYLSPQYLQDGVATESSDIYALGTVAYEMITGKVPFEEIGLYSMVVAKVTQDPPSAQSANPECPPELARIVKRALSRIPEGRYASAAEMNSDLKELYESSGYENALSELPRLTRPEDEDPKLKKVLVRGGISELGLRTLDNILSVDAGVESGTKRSKRPEAPDTLKLADPAKMLKTSRPTEVFKRVWKPSLAITATLSVLLLAVVAAPVQFKGVGLLGRETVAWVKALPSGEQPATGPAVGTHLRALDDGLLRARMGDKLAGGIEIKETALDSADGGSPQAAADASYGVFNPLSFSIAEASSDEPRGEYVPISLDRVYTAQPESRADQGASFGRASVGKDIRPVSQASLRVASSALGEAEARNGDVSASRQSAPARVELASLSRSSKSEVKEMAPIPLDMQIRATLLYRFADYIDWPQASFASDQSPIRLCVLGKDPFGAYLDKQLSRVSSRSHRSFSIGRYMSMAQASELSACHILYLSESLRSKASEIGRMLSGRPVLLVTEDTGHGTIDFVIKDRKVKFAVDNARAKQSGIEIGPFLLDLAVNVREKG